MSAVETSLWKHTDEIDEAAFAKYVAKETASVRRSVTKANAGDRRFRDFVGWTEEQIAECVRAVTGMYRHQFRKMVRVA